MYQFISFLILCVLAAESWAKQCDRFHNRGAIFIGSTGKLILNLGVTEEENKAGEIELKISNCDGDCTIESRWEKFESEGSEDGRYKLELTEKGETEVAKDRIPVQFRRKYLQVAKYVLLSLVINSGTVEGVPKIPNVESVSFGGIFECEPRKPRTIGDICERRPICPAATEKADGFSITLKNEPRRYLRLKIEFASDVNGLQVKRNNVVRYSRVYQRCGNVYNFFVARTKASLSAENVTLSFTLNDTTPEIMFISTKPRHRYSRTCGYACGEFNGCAKPTTAPPVPVTTQPPAATQPQATTQASPSPESPAPESPAPESPATESPEPESPEPESPATESPAPESPAPETPEPVDPAASLDEEDAAMKEVKDVLGDEFNFDDLW